MKLDGLKPRGFVVGLAFALLLALGVGAWMQSVSTRSVGRMTATRSAIASLAALTEVVDRVGLALGGSGGK